MLRPVPANVSDAAKKHVCHLLTLRLVLMEEMMTEFIIGVEVFLGNVRDASESEARILQVWLVHSEDCLMLCVIFICSQ